MAILQSCISLNWSSQISFALVKLKTVTSDALLTPCAVGPRLSHDSFEV